MQILTTAVKEVGQQFLADFRRTPIPQTMNDLLQAVSSIETQCFDALRRQIDAHYPAIPWVDDNEFDGDAQKQPARQEAYWLCDTMDGAIQYLQHIAGWTINIVLVEQGKPHCAVIYDPLTDEMFRAVAGEGAWLNDKRLHTSQKQTGSNMLAVWEYGHQLKKDPDWKTKTATTVNKLLEHFGVVRNYGPHGLQLAYLAAGRIDLFLQTDLDTHNWLAGMLIAQEAGAEIRSVNGHQWQWGDEGLLAGTTSAINLLS